MTKKHLVYRCDPRERKFSPTSLETYLKCRRQYYYAKVLRLTSKTLNIAAEFGSKIHVGVGTFYAVRSMSREESIAKFDPGFTYNGVLSKNELAKLLAIKSFVREWTVQGGDAKHSVLSGTTILDRYCDIYKNDSSKFDINLIECGQWIEMPNDTLLGLIIDRVRVEGKYVTVVDTKTSSWSLTEFFFRKFENSFQMSASYYAIEQIKGYCDGVQIDGIKVPFPPKGKDAFIRKTFDRTDLQMADWLNTYIRCTDEIIKGLKEDEKGRLDFFYQCPTACSDFGGCKYLPICKYGYNHPVVKESFQLEGGKDE